MILFLRWILTKSLHLSPILAKIPISDGSVKPTSIPAAILLVPLGTSGRTISEKLIQVSFVYSSKGADTSLDIHPYIAIVSQTEEEGDPQLAITCWRYSSEFSPPKFRTQSLLVCSLHHGSKYLGIWKRLFLNLSAGS